MNRTRILIIDDHAMLRSGIKLLLASQPDLEVVGEAGDLAQAISIAARLQPDVITLDLSLPGGSGVANVQQVRAAAPSARVLVLTMHDDPAYARSAIALGAAGFVVKSAADTELITAIRAVAAGREYINVPADQPAIADAPESTPLAHLSEREREVFAEVARGYTNQQIADRIGLSVKTVESYRSRLMHKLGLKNRADLMRLAVDVGLLVAPR